MTAYRIIIEGNADNIFLPTIYGDVARMADLSGSVTFEIGNAARVPLVREVE